MRNKFTEKKIMDLINDIFSWGAVATSVGSRPYWFAV